MGSSQSARSFEVLDSQATPKKEKRADCKLFENREMNFNSLLCSFSNLFTFMWLFLPASSAMTIKFKFPPKTVRNDIIYFMMMKMSDAGDNRRRFSIKRCIFYDPTEVSH